MGSVKWVTLNLPGMPQPLSIPVDIGFDPQSLFVHVTYQTTGGGAAGPIMIAVDTTPPNTVGPGRVP